MRGLAITERGIEDICAKEVKELINADAEIRESCVAFNVKKLPDLCLLCYRAQSVSRILFLFEDFSLDGDLFGKINGKIGKVDFSGWLDKGTSFAVRCLKDGNVASAAEIEKKAGEFVIDNIKKNKKYRQEVNLIQPDVLFVVYINQGRCYFGIDFSGFDLSKRGYKIFMHPASLKGTIAYALARIAEFRKKDSLLDPFTGSGMIPTEASLFALNFPVNFYNKDKFAFLKLIPLKNFDFGRFFRQADKKIRKEKLSVYGYDNSMKFVQYAKKNAKIAGIDKQLNFSRVDVEWLDIKFKKGSVDKIAADMPALSKYNKDIEKAYKELFYQSDYILKKDGILVVLVRDLSLIKGLCAEYNFKTIEQRKVYSGKQELLAVKLKK